MELQDKIEPLKQQLDATLSRGMIEEASPDETVVLEFSLSQAALITSALNAEIDDMQLELSELRDLQGPTEGERELMSYLSQQIEKLRECLVLLEKATSGDNT